MHGLSYIHIENFRACKHVFMPLGDFTPLVGQNNVGKSTVLDAIRLVLAPKAFSKNDAYDPEAPVVIAACVKGITPGLINLIPNERHRTAISPYCIDGILWIRISAIGTAKPKQEVWQPGELDEKGLPVQWRNYPTGLPEAVSALLPEALHIQAMDDVQEDLGKGKAGSTIRGLLDEIMAPILTAHTEVNAALETVRNILTAGGQQRSPLLADFDNKATTALANFFPGLRLDLDVPSLEVKELFKSGDLHVTDERGGDRRRFDQMGSGAQRAIQIALVRLLADIRNNDTHGVSRRMLLIDEPELFLHPQGVRRLREALRILSQSGFQVVFSTHSPLMLSRENAPDTVIVRRDKENDVVVKVPLREAVTLALEGAQAQSRTLFELSNVADIYFAEKIILCEGKTDQRLIPLAYERLYGCSPELDHICFISLGSCSSIHKGVTVLASMGIKYGVIADLDFAFTHARSGTSSWLDKSSADMTTAKEILQRLSAQHGFVLAGNGLPLNQNNHSAASVWSLFASDPDGSIVSQQVHELLKEHHTWVWPSGTIEDILVTQEKGEDAIIEQEERLRGLTAEQIDAQIPNFRVCLDWMRSI